MYVLLCLVLLGAALTEAREEDRATDSPDQCVLPKKIGHCRAAFRRYYFNAVTQECEMFLYGGCDTEGNNMRTKQECEEICKTDMDFKAAHTKNGLNLACSLPPSDGKECSPKMFKTEKWHYDPKTETCKNFKFLGCGGNQNQFDDKEECEEICGITTKQEEDDEEGQEDDDEDEEEKRRVSVKKDVPVKEDEEEKRRVSVKKDTPLEEVKQAKKAAKRFKREDETKKLTEKMEEERITKRLKREAKKAKKLA